MRRFRTAVLFTVAIGALSIGWKVPKSAVQRDFGKIAVTETHLFLCEYFRGISIRDITDPATLPEIGYIALPQNNDVAVRGTILYADNADDLLIFDLSTPSSPKLLDSIPNVFRVHSPMPEARQTIYEDTYGGASGCAATSGCSSTDPVYGGPEWANSGGRSTGMDGGGGGGTSTGGSMARFVIDGSYLYCIDVSDLIVFDIRTPETPRLIGRTTVGFDIETLFPYNAYLFIGSRTGMYIYDAQDVRIPRKVAEFRHARACDPVVVEGTRAYVTLRSGNWCGPADNELHVVSIDDITKPELLNTFPMTGPMGLTVADGIAYVCDGPDIRIVDVRDDANLVELSTIPLGNSFDCILVKQLLFVVAPNGLTVFDVSDPKRPSRVGGISAIG